MVLLPNFRISCLGSAVPGAKCVVSTETPAAFIPNQFVHNHFTDKLKSYTVTSAAVLLLFISIHPIIKNTGTSL